MLRYRPGVALIIVDVQNDFADPRGSLAVPGAVDVIPVISAEAALARSGRALVVLTQDWHPPRTPHFVRDGGPWPPHCVMDTWGAELHPALDVPQGTPIVRKGSNGEDGYSAFTMRDPARARTSRRCSSRCSRPRASKRWSSWASRRTTACGRRRSTRSASEFRTTVLTDAIAAVNVAEGDGERALAELEAAGVVLDTSRTR